MIKRRQGHKEKDELRRDCKEGIEKYRRFIWLLIIPNILDIVALFADIILREYWFEWIEKKFLCDKGSGVPILVLEWTVITIPMTFFLEQFGTHIYGIRLVDIISTVFGKTRCVLLGISLGFQLIFTILSATHRWPVLFVTVVWGQVAYVFFFFCLAKWSVSRETVKNIIKEQNDMFLDAAEKESRILEKALQNQSMKEQIETINHFLTIYKDTIGSTHWLLLDMIKNTDYCKVEEVDTLEEVFKKNVCSKLSGIAGKKIVFYLFQNLTEVADIEIVKRLFFSVFDDERISCDARKGILAALIYKRESDCYQWSMVLMENMILRNVNGDNSTELLWWGFLWGIYLQPSEMDLEYWENMNFINEIQRTLEDNHRFKNTVEKLSIDIVLESYLDFILMTETEERNALLVKLLENKVEFYEGEKETCGMQGS